MNKFIFTTFAIFAASYAQSEPEPESSESKASICYYEAQMIQESLATCFAEQGTISPDPEPAKCPCFNASSAFYKANPDCMGGNAELVAFYESYAKQCIYNKCEGCVEYDCNSNFNAIYDEAKTCLALYTEKDRDSYFERCKCIESLKTRFSKNPQCRNETAEIYTYFESTYKYNFCDDYFDEPFFSEESKGYICLYEAQMHQDSLATCFVAQGTTSPDPEPAKCPCFNASSAFYKANPDCPSENEELAGYYESYIRQCVYNKCEGCVEYDCEAWFDETFNEAKTCLNNYNPGNKSSDYGRCMCIEPLKKQFELHSGCKNDPTKTKEMYRIAYHICVENDCDDCDGLAVPELCEDEAKDAHSYIPECIAALGLSGTTAPEPQKCPCLNETKSVFNLRPECRARARDTYIDYLRQCSYNKCGNCTEPRKCEADIAEIVASTDVCLGLLDTVEEGGGETKTPDYARCACLNGVASYLEDNSVCKYSSNETIELVKKYAGVNEFNGCNYSALLSLDCEEDAHTFEKEADACLEMFNASDAEPNTERCTCIDAYKKFFDSENGACKETSAQVKRIFDKYVSQCLHNNCENCPGEKKGNGASYVTPIFTVLTVLAVTLLLF